MTARKLDRKRREEGRHTARATLGRRGPFRKPPDAWITGGRPMTDAQARYLKLLCERAGEAFFARLTKAEASQRIRVLLSRRW